MAESTENIENIEEAELLLRSIKFFLFFCNDQENSCIAMYNVWNKKILLTPNFPEIG